MTDVEIARTAFEAYRDAPPVLRGLQALRPFICPIERLLREIRPGSRVLDVGCGAGLLLLAGALSGRVASGCGVDISERARQAARQALATTGKSAAVDFQSAAVGELLPGPFDVVTLIDVMHHVPPVEQQGLFAAAANRVRPGGVLLYKDMCAKPRWKAWASRLHDLALAANGSNTCRSLMSPPGRRRSGSASCAWRSTRAYGTGTSCWCCGGADRGC
jgi:2-polyprenyl-3-methyl-5-hydroxy-6-metoxy-1,4-benzoquinol methylase